MRNLETGYFGFVIVIVVVCFIPILRLLGKAIVIKI